MKTPIEVESLHAERKAIPIVPRSGLYMEAFGHGDDQRFARLFRETWHKIPLGPRRRMLAHWRRDCLERRLASWIPVGRPVTPHGLAPRIQLLNGWGLPSSGVIIASYDPDEWGVGEHQRRPSFAVGFCRGYLLRFWAPSIDLMPDQLAHHLIAHELAHVFQDSFENRELFLCDEPPEWEVEQHADELIERWGFGEHGELDDWSGNVGWSKTLVFASYKDLAAHLVQHGDRHTAPWDSQSGTKSPRTMLPAGYP